MQKLNVLLLLLLVAKWQLVSSQDVAFDEVELEELGDEGETREDQFDVPNSDDVITAKDLQLFASESDLDDEPEAIQILSADDEANREDRGLKLFSRRTDRGKPNRRQNILARQRLPAGASPSSNAKKGPQKNQTAAETSPQFDQQIDQLLSNLTKLVADKADSFLVAITNQRAAPQVPVNTKKKQGNQSTPNIKLDRAFLNSSARVELNDGLVSYYIGQATNQSAARSSVNESAELQRQIGPAPKNNARLNGIVSGVHRIKRDGPVAKVTRSQAVVYNVPVQVGPLSLQFRETAVPRLRKASVDTVQLPAALLLKQKDGKYTDARLVKRALKGRVAQQITVPAEEAEARASEERLVSHLSFEATRLWKQSVFLRQSSRMLKSVLIPAKPKPVANEKKTDKL